MTEQVHDRDTLAALIESSGSLPCHANEQVNLTNARGIADAILTSDWLAKVAAEVGAKALRDAAVEVDGYGLSRSARDSDYWEGWDDATQKVRDVLIARATTTTEVGADG